MSTSKRAQERARLAEDLSAGRITQARFDARIARMKVRRRGADSQAKQVRMRADKLLASCRIDQAEHAERLAGVQEWSPGSHRTAGATPPAAPRTPGKHVRNVSAAHEALRVGRAARIAALRVPAPFESADAFLLALGQTTAAHYGGVRNLAAAVGVHDSTVSKWLRSPPLKRPSQAKLDAAVAWWQQRKAGMPPAATGTDDAVVAVGARESNAPQTRGLGLTNLPPEIAERLRRAARRANVSPVVLCAQILDQRLPQLSALQ